MKEPNFLLRCLLQKKAEKFKMDAKYEKDNTGGNIARVLLFWPALAMISASFS